MTDEEWITKWLDDDDFDFLFDFLDGMARPNERKLRLFAVGLCRSIWHLLGDENSRIAIEIAEAFADGNTTPESLRTVNARVESASLLAWNRGRVVDENGARFIATKEDALASDIPNLANTVTKEEFDEVGARDTVDVALCVVAHAAIPPQLWGTGMGDHLAQQATEKECQRQLRVFRCVIGNPFRPAQFDCAWLAWNGGTIPKIAQAIYDDRAFDRMPILADALEEAGCTNADMLDHCRSGGEHVRGCWVVDLLLRKE
jgi:hypothetical protein